jgi:hypothetical protein
MLRERVSEVATYDRGDLAKVEFESEGSLPSEWMWVRVDHCDEQQRLVFGTLDNHPLVNAEILELGASLVLSFDKVREHRNPGNFDRSDRPSVSSLFFPRRDRQIAPEGLRVQRTGGHQTRRIRRPVSSNLHPMAEPLYRSLSDLTIFHREPIDPVRLEKRQ